jgi:hypothetical protein
MRSSGRGGSGNIVKMRKALEHSAKPDKGEKVDALDAREREILAAYRNKKLAAAQTKTVSYFP